MGDSWDGTVEDTAVVCPCCEGLLPSVVLLGGKETLSTVLGHWGCVFKGKFRHLVS